MSRLLLTMLLLFPISCTAKKSRFTKYLLAKKQECTRKKSCEYDFSENCVNFCISKVCYDQIYSNSPLEDGEIDMPRHKVFIKCVKNQYIYDSMKLPLPYHNNDEDLEALDEDFCSDYSIKSHTHLNRDQTTNDCLSTANAGQGN